MAIRVNLLPREARPKRAAAAGFRLSLSGTSLVVWGGWALVALVAVILVGGQVKARRDRTALTAEVAQLNEQDKALRLKLTELDLAQRAKREIERRIEIIAKVAKSQKIPLAMMNGVVSSVPQGIWLTSYDLKPQEVQVQVEARRPAIRYSGTLQALTEKQQEAEQAKGAKKEMKTVTELRGFTIVIRGVAFNNFQVADFMENLRNAGFSDVDFTLTQAASVEQVRVINFEITGSVKL